jgi:hypothetical protein
LLTRWRVYIRILALLSTLVSLGLIIAGLVTFSRALHNLPKSARNVSTKPCKVFIGIAAGNTVLAITVLLLSSKWRCLSLSATFVSAIFGLSGAVASASSMAACLFLSGASGDLWQFACQGAKNGAEGSGFEYGKVCHVIELSWRFGLVQAALEMSVVVMTVMAIIVLQWIAFARYGRVGWLGKGLMKRVWGT